VTEAALGDRATRMERIRAALAALDPVACELVDEGHRHVGHEGARDGRGHFALRIASPRFAGQGRIARHRLVYEALGELMRTDVHAISIDALAPGET